MRNKNRVLITGVNGYIGNYLKKKLVIAGYEVWGISRNNGDNKRTFAVNLLNLDKLELISKKIPNCFTLIHTAAIAHNQKVDGNTNILSLNTRITELVLKVFSKKIDYFIFLSSVAVYGEFGRDYPIKVDDNLMPANDYGKSKLLCEKIFFDFGLKNYSVLRLTPVFDSKNMNDIKKRVFFPGSNFLKLSLKPEPSYSLANISTVINSIFQILRTPPKGINIKNIADDKVHKQSELLSLFKGLNIIVPVFIFKPINYLTYLIPFKYGYNIRCLIWKLTQSNIYDI